jgi:hypothetical protein
MDRCNDCGADLAIDDRPFDEPTPAQMWDAECTFDLIAATHRPGLTPVTSAQFQAFVVKLVGELAAGSCSRLGEATGLGANSLRNWTWGRSRPSFLQAMRFFRSIRCPASALVSGYPLIIDPALIEQIDEEPLRAVLAFPKDDVANLKKKLLALLKSTSASPLSLKAVARRLGRSVQLLKYRYPEICDQIIATAKQHRSKEAERRQASRERRVQRALEECADSGIYPSDRHLRHVTGIEPSDLRRDNLKTIVHAFREQLRNKKAGGGRPPRPPSVGQALDLREQAEAARSTDLGLSIDLYSDIASSTNDPADWTTLLELYQHAGRFSDAINLATDLRRRFECNAAVQRVCGSVLFSSGQHEDAALAYERALELSVA